MKPTPIQAFNISETPKVLLLQGPVGPFFRDLHKTLVANGVGVKRVQFNVADGVFALRQGSMTRFSGSVTAWNNWLRSELVLNRPDFIILFGSLRPAHRVAVNLAKEFNVQVISLEEGYLRSGYVTCEIGGNNQNSPLCNWSNAQSSNCKVVAPIEMPSSFVAMSVNGTIYYIVRDLFSKKADEQKDFYDRIAAHFKKPIAPLLLEGTAGLGKTRAMALALLESGNRVAMVFPTHQLINQFLASSDLEAALKRCPRSVRAFRPRTLTEEDGGDYEQMKLEAAASDLLLCTMSSVIIDQRLGGSYNGVTERDVILFDEADQLPSMAGLMAEFDIPKAKLSELGVKERTPITVVDAVLKIKMLEPEVRASAKVIKETLEGEEVWFRKAGMTANGPPQYSSPDGQSRG